MNAIKIPLVPLKEFGHVWQDNTRQQNEKAKFGFEAFFTIYGEDKKGDPTERHDALKLVKSFLAESGTWRIDQGIPQSWSLKADSGKLSAKTRKAMTATANNFRLWLKGREFKIAVPNSLNPAKANEDQTKTSVVVLTGDEVTLVDMENRGSTIKDSQWKHRCHSTFRRTMFVVPIFNALVRKLGLDSMQILHLPVQHKVFVSEELAEEDRRKENNLKLDGFRRLNSVDDLYNGRRHMIKFGYLTESELMRKLGVNRGRIQKIYATLSLDKQHPDLKIVDSILSGKIPFGSIDKEVARKLVVPDDPRDPAWELKDEKPYGEALSPSAVLKKAGVAPTTTSGIGFKAAEMKAVLAVRKTDVEQYYLVDCTVKRPKAVSLVKTLKTVKDGSPVQIVKDLATAISARDSDAIAEINKLASVMNPAYVAAQAGLYMLITPDGDAEEVPEGAVKAVLSAIAKSNKAAKKA